MVKIHKGEPANNIFVYDASTGINDPGCIRVFIMKDMQSAWEHAFSLDEAKKLADSILTVIDEHEAKYSEPQVL